MTPFLLLNPKTREIALVQMGSNEDLVFTVLLSGRGLMERDLLTQEDMETLSGTLGKGVVERYDDPAPGFARIHTPAGVKYRGRGWGTVLYSALALAAARVERHGIASPVGGRSLDAEAWWERAVEGGIAESERHWHNDLASWINLPVREGRVRRADLAQHLFELRGVRGRFEITQFIGENGRSQPLEPNTLRDSWELFDGDSPYNSEEGFQIVFDAEFEVNLLRAETASKLVVAGYESEQFEVAPQPLDVLTGLRVISGETLGEVATALVIEAFLRCDARLEDQVRGFHYFASQNRIDADMIEAATYRIEPRLADKTYLALTEPRLLTNSRNLDQLIEQAYDAEFGPLRELE